MGLSIIQLILCDKCGNEICKFRSPVDIARDLEEKQKEITVICLKCWENLPTED